MDWLSVMAFYWAATDVGYCHLATAWANNSSPRADIDASSQVSLSWKYRFSAKAEFFRISGFLIKKAELETELLRGCVSSVKFPKVCFARSRLAVASTSVSTR